MAAIKENRNYPDLAACEALWEAWDTPGHVIGHCKAVSATASAIGRKLNEKGSRLNIPLIEAAGWLHDIARTDEYHWEKGAEIAEKQGWTDVAEIIRIHMNYRIDGKTPEITETDLVCMADRMVKEDHYVGPDERMDYIIEKAREFPGSEARIRSSFREIRALKKRIEGLMGISVEDLMCSE